MSRSPVGQIKHRQHRWHRIAAGGDQPREAQAGQAAEDGDEAGFGSTSTSTRPLVKPIALSTPSSSVRSRTDCAMVLPATSRMVKNTALEHGR